MNSLSQHTSVPAVSSATTFGYKLGVFGVVLVLLWIGIFKFTPTEAAAIEPLIKNHPLMGWAYNFLSVQMVSNLVGFSEIVVAGGLIYGFLILESVIFQD